MSSELREKTTVAELISRLPTETELQGEYKRTKEESDALQEFYLGLYSDLTSLQLRSLIVSIGVVLADVDPKSLAATGEVLEEYGQNKYFAKFIAPKLGGLFERLEDVFGIVREGRDNS